jgi:hypothetical protein
MKTQKILVAISLFLVISLTSCFRFDFEQNDRIIGQGPVIEQELTLDEFTKIENSSSINVVVEQGPVQKVLAVGQANIIEHLRTRVTNQCWNISLENGSYSFFELTIYVTVPKVESIKVSGSGKVTLEDFNQETNPTISLSGSGNFKMNRLETADELNVSISGSGSFYAEKYIDCFEKLIVQTNGSGSFKGFDIRVKDCQATTSGSGNIQVFVSDNLDATITGSGDIVYKGSPRVNSSDNGSGNLRQAY